MMTKSNLRPLALLTLGLPLLLVALPACTNEAAPADNAALLPENQRVGTVPWNRPESWESRNALGALSNDPRFSGGR